MLTKKQIDSIKELYSESARNLGKLSAKKRFKGMNKNEISENMRKVRFGWKWNSKKKQEQIKNNA